MKLLFHGPLWRGGTALQRAEAMAQVPGVSVIQLDFTDGRRAETASLYSRVRWRLGVPVDTHHENVRLLALVVSEKPDVVLVDNSKVITEETLQALREICAPLLVYYTPDDVMAPQNLKRPLRRSFHLWDLLFTTKTFNIPELKLAGVRNPVLVGNSFALEMHRPMTRAEVGTEFEAFDVVFIGAFEHERCTSLNALAEAGMSVLIHGSSPGASAGKWKMHSSITLRPPVFAESYTRALHTGKIALCFLRKINRDRITTRSIEMPAMARPMLAEKTEEHDAHFVDGSEYVGFASDAELIEKAKSMLADNTRRIAIGKAARLRCLTAGYSTGARAEQMIDTMRAGMTTLTDKSADDQRVILALGAHKACHD